MLMHPLRAILALLLMALLACSTPESEEELLARAQSALAEGRVSAAVVDIKSALQQNAESATARRLLGETYMLQRDPASAVTEFRRAMAADGSVDTQVRYAQALAAAGDLDALLALHAEDPAPVAADAPGYQAAVARAQSTRGDFDAAEALLEKARSQAAEDPYVMVSEALVGLRAGAGTFDAAEILARATEAHPENDEAWSLRADVARLEQDFASAAEWYARAAEINPYRLTDRLNLVGVHIQLGDTESANTELAQLEKLIPDHPGVNFARGRLLVEAGDYKQGLQELSRVLSAMPDHNATLYLSAVANIREGNEATAQRQLIRFLKDQPRHLPARLELASLHLRQDDPRAAERIARELLEEDDENIQAMRLLALALSTQRLHAESAQIYQKVSSLEPESAEVRMGLGAAHLLSGDTDAGVRELESAVEMDPQSVPARERLIGVYLAVGDLESAREAVKDYAEIADADSVRPQIFAGRVELQAGNQDAARAAFESVLKKNPGSVDAHGGLAALALVNSDLDGARRHFNDTLKANPGDLKTLMNIAVIEEQAGDFEAMQAALEAGIDANPQALQPRVALARYRTSQGQARDAIRLLDEVRKEYAEDFALHQTLAAAYLGSEQPGLAVDSGRKILAQRPEDPATLALVARIEQANDRPEKAGEHLEKALTLAPDNVDLRKLLVETLLARNDLERARTELAKLPEDVRNEPGVLSVKGRIAMTQNRAAEAVNLFQQAFEKQASSVNLILLTTAQWALDKRDESIAQLRDWLDSHPDDMPVRNQLATRYLTLGDDAAARTEYRKLVDSAPDNPLFLNNLSWLLRETDTDEALALIQRANRKAPDSVQILDTHAMVEHARGNHLEALKLSDRALSMAPDSPDLQFNRALILVQAGRPGEAQDVLRTLVSGPAFSQQDEAEALLATLGGN